MVQFLDNSRQQDRQDIHHRINRDNLEQAVYRAIVSGYPTFQKNYIKIELEILFEQLVLCLFVLHSRPLHPTVLHDRHVF